MRTYDMLRVAEALAHRVPELFSLEMWGGATFDTAMRFLSECPWERLRRLREKIPNLCFQMLFRGSNAVGYSNYPDNVVAGFVKHAADSGMDIFRIFDSLNYLPNMQVAMEAARDHGKVLCEAAICYTGDINDEKRDKYSLKYYIEKAKEVETHGRAHPRHQGHGRTLQAARRAQARHRAQGRRSASPSISTPTTPPASTPPPCSPRPTPAWTSWTSPSPRCPAPPRSRTSTPSPPPWPRPNAIPASTFDSLNELSDYWEEVLGYYKPFDSAPRAGTAEVYEHEMPGGQYTNLREQANSMGLGHRWREIARTYAEVNQLFGDIVKVTPSSKVVGDMCMFLVTRGIKAADVVKLKPGSIDFPESVIDMLSGGLGQPDGGWPADVQKVVLGNKKATTMRPGELADPVDLEVTRAELTEKLGHPASDDDLYSHLMYPQVFADFTAFKEKYDDLSGLPTPAFFYGLQIGEEIEIEIDPGKILIIKLISIGEADTAGRRALFYELNGMPRESMVATTPSSPPPPPAAPRATRTTPPKPAPRCPAWSPKSPCPSARKSRPATNSSCSKP